jgi:uncharacterized membrane protein YfcA
MLLVAVLAGLGIGLSLGALGSGGSILAVPVLVYLLGQSPLAATTGSLVVVAVAALTGALLAHRAGHVYVGRGLAFSLLGTGGAALGATWSVHVDPQLLMTLFAGLLLVVAATMARRLFRDHVPTRGALEVDAPIIAVSPTFMCDCPRALKVLVTGVAVGTLTGFLGVGGGFLVVPALVLALGLPMPAAVGTSLLVIAVNSLAAFGVRMAHGVALDWPPLILLTVAAVVGSVVGRRLAGRVDPRRLGFGFVALLVAVGGYTAVATLS